MPYVRTLHNFRLLNENAMLKRAGIEENQIGGLTEVLDSLRIRRMAVSRENGHWQFRR